MACELVLSDNLAVVTLCFSCFNCVCCVSACGRFGFDLSFVGVLLARSLVFDYLSLLEGGFYFSGECWVELLCRCVLLRGVVIF